jgi:hypothetical protein
MGGTWSVLPLLLLTGCAQPYRVTRSSSATAPSLTVQPTARFYVAVPADAHFQDIIYQGSGRRVAAALATAFRKHVTTVVVGVSAEDLAAALVSAQRSHCDYIVLPEIVQWRGRQTTSWVPSGQLSVRITIVDVMSHDQVDSAEISAHSSWWTFRGDDPQNLLPIPLGEYVDGLFGALP